MSAAERLDIGRLRHRLALMAGLTLAVAAFAMATARPAEAYVDYFCPWSGGTQYFSSGQTCGHGEYHHLKTVAFSVDRSWPNYRHCANMRFGSDTSGPLSTWVCGYDTVVIKNGAGKAGRGIVHNGDPDGFRGFANETF